MAQETLDELDEVADLMMLLPTPVAEASPVGEARADETCDQYGFPLEPELVEPYKDFMASYYYKHQARMRSKWLRFLQKVNGSFWKHIDEGSLLTLSPSLHRETK